MKNRKKNKKGYSMDDLNNMKKQNAAVKLLKKNKGIVICVLAFVVIEIADIVVTFLMAFKLI